MNIPEGRGHRIRLKAENGLKPLIDWLLLAQSFSNSIFLEFDLQNEFIKSIVSTKATGVVRRISTTFTQLGLSFEVIPSENPNEPKLDISKGLDIGILNTLPKFIQILQLLPQSGAEVYIDCEHMVEAHYNIIVPNINHQVGEPNKMALEVCRNTPVYLKFHSPDSTHRMILTYNTFSGRDFEIPSDDIFYTLGMKATNPATFVLTQEQLRQFQNLTKAYDIKGESRSFVIKSTPNKENPKLIDIIFCTEKNEFQLYIATIEANTDNTEVYISVFTNLFMTSVSALKSDIFITFDRACSDKRQGFPRIVLFVSDGSTETLCSTRLEESK